MNQYESLPTSDPEKQTQLPPTACTPKSGGSCQPAQTCCNRHAAWKKYLVAFFLFFLSFSITSRIYRSVMHPTSTSTYDDSSFVVSDDLRFCEDAELIPWRGNGEFAIDAASINSLVVKLKGSTQNGLVNIHSHYAEEGDSVVNISITFRLSDERLQRTISIDTSMEDDIFFILINTPRELVDDCIKAEIDISFPSSLGAFGNLEVKVPNFDVFEHCIVDELRFSSVDIGVANGDIYVTNLVATSVVIRTVNGDIKGNFGIAEDFSANTVNGWVNASIAPFVDEDAEAKWDLSAKSVNGFIKLALSSAFEGRFSLYTMFGVSRLSSDSKPDSVHFEKKRRNLAKGYFGAPDARGKVSLEGVSGDVEVVFE